MAFRDIDWEPAYIMGVITAGVFVMLSAIGVPCACVDAFAKQELYKQKTGRDISFFTALGMPKEACIPSEADKTYNINLGSAKKEK